MITFNYQNVMADRVGPEHGLSPEDLDRAIARTGEFCARFDRECREGVHGFTRLPHDRAAADAVAAYARQNRDRFRAFVQIGIGGSALGAIAVHTALSHRFHNEAGRTPRFYALDNVDPEETQALFDVIRPEETLFHVVTKSGDTTETMAGFLLALKLLRERVGPEWKRHLAVTTDPQKGFLRRFAREEGIAAFDLPEPVGGRFSVLTPVGLLPAAALGIEPTELLEGAAAMDALCRRTDPRANPAYLFALVAHLLDAARGKRIHVMMPYSRALRDVADWFRQLWAESLGKNSAVGPTPVVALGTTDQHSQIQLYNEGPLDKYVVFLECGRFRVDPRIPGVLPGDASPAFLQGKTFGEVLTAMKRGTEAALVQARRPNATLRLAEISARSVGALFYLLEAATLFAGRLYGVNPFDQPGVEAGKKTAFALLGRPGFSAPPAPAEDRRYVVP
jgi:glucose-6-phosphate isomerase